MIVKEIDLFIYAVRNKEQEIFVALKLICLLLVVFQEVEDNNFQ